MGDRDERVAIVRLGPGAPYTRSGAHQHQVQPAADFEMGPEFN
jgi:hypothetical protein